LSSTLAGQLTVYDLGGRQILQQPYGSSVPRTVNLALQPAGVYLVWVQIDDQLFRGRVVKR
ncbi:MAG: T9SS type A sorting domain-containing protein, partial [Bacteroidota bacterium]